MESAGKRTHRSVILCYPVSLRLVWAVRPLLRNKANQTQKIQFKKQTNLWEFKGRLFFIASSGEASATNQPKSTTKNPTHTFQLQLRRKPRGRQLAHDEKGTPRLGTLAHGEKGTPRPARWHMALVPILDGDLGSLKHVHGCSVCAPPCACLVPRNPEKNSGFPKLELQVRLWGTESRFSQGRNSQYS